MIRLSVKHNSRGEVTKQKKEFQLKSSHSQIPAEALEHD